MSISSNLDKRLNHPCENKELIKPISPIFGALGWKDTKTKSTKWHRVLYSMWLSHLQGGPPWKKIYSSGAISMALPICTLWYRIRGKYRAINEPICFFWLFRKYLLPLWSIRSMHICHYIDNIWTVEFQQTFILTTQFKWKSPTTGRRFATMRVTLSPTSVIRIRCFRITINKISSYQRFTRCAWRRKRFFS